MSDSIGPADADLDAMAKLDFAAWDTETFDWTPPSNTEWAALANPHLISVRLAWLAVHKSKAGLASVAAQLGDAGMVEMVSQIGQSADWFERLQKLLATAEARLMCAYGSRIDREDNGSAGDPSPAG